MNPLASLANRRRRLALSPYMGRAEIVECWDYDQLITFSLLPFTFFMKISEIYNFLNSFSPFATQEPWDNSGLTIGDPDRNIETVYLALDITDDVITRAISAGAELIITHHPVIFSPIKNISSTSLCYKLIQNNLTCIALHTPLDITHTAEALIRKLGYENFEAIPDCPFMRIFDCGEMTAGKLATEISEKLECSVQVNLPGKILRKIAVVTGSAGEFYVEAKKYGADALLTGEAKYHEMLNATHEDTAILVAGHYDTEIPAVYALRKIIANEFPELSVYAYDGKSPIKTYLG